MVKTPSTMVALGTLAPEFALFDTISENVLSYHQISQGRPTVVMFICNHCPFVVHIEDELVGLALDYQSKEVAFVAISSSDVTQVPEDGPAEMKERAKRLGFPFPYLFDETQEAAQAYNAACTPDFFLFDSNRRLVYRGQLDSSRPGNDIPVTGSDLRAALDALLQNIPIPEPQLPSIGCNIKWIR